jgi:hypothetical protein
MLPAEHNLAMKHSEIRWNPNFRNGSASGVAGHQTMLYSRMPKLNWRCPSASFLPQCRVTKRNVFTSDGLSV